MKRSKIDYGIDLGTTNSALVRVDGDTLKIIKSKDDQRDTTPSSVAYSKKGSVSVGTSAFSTYRDECRKSMKRKIQHNAFIEFKRTMGTDQSYYSSNSDAQISPEQLSAEVLMHLKSYVSDENIEAAVITIPAAYTMNQIDAVRRAANFAGLSYIETLQEPVAAAMAYGVEGKGKNGFWLVYDFGGGTFDAALVKVEDGIVKVIDSSGDNRLGGRDLDMAIVDNIIIPHIKSNYEINGLLSDPRESTFFRSSLKFEAEKIKNHLSFQNEYELYIEPGEIRDDDNGEPIEIDLNVTKIELRTVIEPTFQKAIDLSLELLERNNLKGEQLSSLILVGGPTLSPVLRDMVSKQICVPDTSVDPMTVVARGASIYASTVSMPDDILDTKRDRTKIQIGLDYEASSVEETEFVTLKLLTEKTDDQIPEKVYVQLQRSDGAWTSEKIEIDSVGEVCDVDLAEGKTNSFSIILYDDKGNRIDCEPSSFNIIQGSVLGNMPLPHNVGVEMLDIASGDLVFSVLKGLEKNTTLPSTGVPKKELKTQKDIRPGIKEDFLKIPLYQGNNYDEGTRAIYNEHIYDVIISGQQLPRLLPAGSTVELIVSISRDQKMKLEGYFPYLDYTYEIEVPTNNIQSINIKKLLSEFSAARKKLSEIDAPESLSNRLEEAVRRLNANPDDMDTKSQAREELRKVLKEIDSINKCAEWPNLKRKLKYEFKRLEDANKNLGDDETTQNVDSFRRELDVVLGAQDLKAGKQLLDSIARLIFQLTKVYQLIGLIHDMDNHFDSYHWSDRIEARSLICRGQELIMQQAGAEKLESIVFKLLSLLPKNKPSKNDDSVLAG